MARRRMIDPTIWTNRKFLRLGHFERLLFIGLVSQADDEGRLWNDGLALKAGIFPADSLSLHEVECGLERLASVGLIACDESAIQLVGWAEHQTIDRPKKSTVPEVTLTTEKAQKEPVKDNRRTIDDASPNNRRTIDDASVLIEVKGIEVKESKTQERERESDHVSESFSALRNSFQSKNPLWPDSKREVEAIHKICALAAQDGNELQNLRTWTESFWAMTQGQEQFWRKQPFLPSRMLALLADIQKRAPPTREEFSGDWINDYQEVRA